jgi:hypothetical protein
MSSSRTSSFIASLALAVVLIAASTAMAEVPQKINYQGRLIDNVTGEPRVGSHSMIFRIYDAVSEGTELWSETHVVVADSAGVVAIILGDKVPIDVAFDGATWLQVEVMGEALWPRRELVSVPYAFRASDADSLGGHAIEEFVLKGELSSITAGMIVDGSGSGLDADMVDGLNADAFADSGHVHDDRYYTQDSLSTPGTVNDASNPVDWTKLKGVPGDFADGKDNVGEAADGYSLDADDGDPVDAVYVDADGDVGVGTTSPGEKLEVSGTVHSTSGGFKFPDGTVQSTAVTGVEIGGGWVDDSTVVRLESPGDSVGIGTGTPGAKVDVVGTVRMEGFALPTGADSGSVLTSDADGVGTWQASPVYADTAHDHDDLYYTESELNTSDGDGPNTGSNRVSWDNLTDVPADFADGSDEVGGTGDGHSLDAVDGDPTNVIYVNNDGSVGVGTTAPEHELDVLGTVRMDGFILPSDTSYGHVLTSDSSGTGTWQVPLADGHSLDSPSGFYEDVVYVDNDGYVGVGTDDPSGELHVYGDKDGQVSITIENPNTGVFSGERISFENEDGSVCAIVAYDDDGAHPNKLRIFNNRPGGTVGFSTTAGLGDDLHIDDSGKVGIKTNSPGEALDVNGTARMTGFSLPTGAASGHVLTSDGNGTGTWQPSAIGDGHSLDADDGDPVDALYVNQYGHVGIGTDYPMWDLHVHNPDPNQCVMLMSNATTGTGTGDGLRFTMSHVDGDSYITNFEPGSLRLGTGGIVSTLSINPDMKVGINNTEPNYELHIHRGGVDTDCNMQMTNYSVGYGTGDGLIIGMQSDSTAYMVNQEEGDLLLGTEGATYLAITEPHGYVGIGTTNPESRLHLHAHGPSTCYGQWTNGTTGDGFNDGLRMGIYTDGRAYIRNSENTDLAVLTNAAERMRIAANGDVGIGDNDPRVKLAVTGVARIQNLAAWPTEGVGMELAYFSDLHRGYIQVYDRDADIWGDLYLGDGHVGIGIKSPTSKLDVEGDGGHNQLRLRQSYTPTGTSDPKGETGDIAWDDNCIYVKTSAGWKRASLEMF